MLQTARESTIDAILRAVSRFPNGGSLGEIIQSLESPIPERTLQRRLALLVQEKRLVSTGAKKDRTYRLPKPIAAIEPAESTFEAQIAELAVSSDAEALRQAVRSPRHMRIPVGYNREFLDGYRPNETFYLPEETRVHLRAVGYAGEQGLPPGTHARQVFNRLLIDLAWNSSRLEGNTYSLLETERLLELSERAEGKNAAEAQMILNHKAAIEFLVEGAEEIGFNRSTIFNLHAALSENLMEDQTASGRLRHIPVGIGGTVYHPLGVPQLVEECLHQILDSATAIRDPFEQAFFAMVQIPYLQPFEDVNKRVSRLAANIPLIRNNLSPLSFVDVPARDYVDGIRAVYELNRVELLRDVFVWAYERSSARYALVQRSLGQPDLFRLRHRTLLKDAVGDVLRRPMDKKQADLFIKARAEAMAPEDRLRFMEVAETELQSLHEGNFARYRVRPSEFEVWRKNWR